MIKGVFRKFLLNGFAVLFLLAGLSVNPSFALDNNLSLVDLGCNKWNITTDSGWAGASQGSINKLRNNPRTVEFIYQLNRTKLWPWPEIDFWISFKEAQDLSRYSGIKLIVTSKQEEEIYVYFMAEDNNLKALKPLMQRCLFNGSPRQEIILFFSDFKIAKDWSPRNPGYEKSIDWRKVSRFGMHKKGVDNEKGSILVHDIEFLYQSSMHKKPRKERAKPPKHYSFTLKDDSRVKCRDLILISGSARGSISPYFYGSNWGAWLDLPDKEKTAYLRLKILRAGGPFMDRYDWRKSEFTFPGNNKEVGMVNLGEFIQYCRSIAAEPLIQINALGLFNSRGINGQIDEKSVTELIRYLNKENGYGVRFFEIGNEPFIWHKVHFDLRADPCSVKEYFELFKKISLAIKNTQAKIDPDLKIKIFAPAIETSWLGWSSFSGEDRQEPVLGKFLKMCRDFEEDKSTNPKGIKLLDVLSFHLFPSFKETKAIKKLGGNNLFILESAQTWWNRGYVNKYDASLPIGQTAGVIPKLKEVIKDNYPGVELAITEFNIESESMVSYDPLIKVLYLADLYGIMAKYGIDYSMQFCLNSSDQNIALMDDLDNITPLYYLLTLYAGYFKGVMLDVKSSLSDRLNAYACNNNGDIVIMAVNKDNIAHQARVLLETEKKNGVSFIHDFPALSLTCIKIDKNNPDHTVECWEYGRQQIN